MIDLPRTEHQRQDHNETLAEVNSLSQCSCSMADRQTDWQEKESSRAEAGGPSVHKGEAEVTLSTETSMTCCEKSYRRPSLDTSHENQVND